MTLNVSVLTTGILSSGSNPTTAAISPAPYSTVYIFMTATGTPGVPYGASSTIAGNPAWTKIADVTTTDAARRLVVFRAKMGSAPGTGKTISVSWPDLYATEWHVIQAQGQDATDFERVTTGSGTGTALSISMPAGRDANSRPLAFWCANGAITPRTNWTELAERSNSGRESEWRSGAFETTASATAATSNVWAGAALELYADLAKPDVTVLTSDDFAVSSNSVTTASISPAANSVVYLVMQNRSAPALPSSVSGLGATWTQVATATEPTGFMRTTVYRAIFGATPGSGAITVNWAAANAGRTWTVLQAVRVDTTNPDRNFTTANGTGVLSLSVTLPAAAGSNSRSVVAFAMDSQPTNPNAGWYELTEVGSGWYVEAQFRPDGFDPTASASFGFASSTVGIAWELLADPGITLIPGSDTGTFADAESVATAASDDDTGTLADAESLTTGSADADTGSVIEGEVISVQVFDGDAISFVEGETADIGTVPVSDADTATFTDAETVAAGGADNEAGSLVESESLATAQADADTAALVEAESVLRLYVGADTAALVEAESVAANYADDDPATFTESESVLRLTLIGDADAAAFSESETVTIGFAPTLTSADVLLVAAGGGLSDLTDDFPHAFLDTAKWTVDVGAVTVEGNRAGVDTSGTGPTILESARTYNARGGELVIRGARPSLDGPTVRASVQLVDPGGGVGIHQVGGGQLVMRIEHGGVADDVTVTYDPTRDVYWRIRESLGQVLMATSPTGDSGSWVTFRQEPHRLNLTAVRVVLTASSYAAGTWGHGPWGHTPWGGGG